VTRMSLPRRTVRLRLTMLYVGLFLASTAVLLMITYFLVRSQLPQTSVVTRSSSPGDHLFAGTGVMTGTPPSVAPPSVATSAGVTSCQPPLNDPAGAGSCIAFLEHQAASLRESTLTNLLIYSGIGLGIMAVVSVGLGWLMAGRVLRPLRVITATARRISASNLDSRLALAGPDDELKELGDTVDDLLGRLETSFRAQRQFVANASHELRTPLARQQTLLEVALRDTSATSDQLRATCARVLAAGQQQEHLIAALLTLASSERGIDRFERFDLGELALDSLTGHMAQASARDVTLRTDLSPAPSLGDPRLAGQLVTNLIDNAVRHNVPGGWLDVASGMRSGRPFLRVANAGPEIPAGEVGRLFRPFQRLERGRTVGPDDGTGLGLAIVAAIAAAHGAVLHARPCPGGGLAIEAVFPPPSADTCQPLAVRTRVSA
jgi:signal transduction histidine kinase